MCAAVNLLIDIEIWPSYSYNPVLQKRICFLGFLIYFDKNQVVSAVTGKSSNLPRLKLAIRLIELVKPKSNGTQFPFDLKLSEFDNGTQSMKNSIKNFP